MNTKQDVLAYLQQYGIKPSLQRIIIAEYLMENHIHPTVDDIYDALYIKVPTLSKTTVYNTLKLFVQEGAVQSLVIDDKNMRFDINISYHAHFQCTVCRRVFDIPSDKLSCLEVKQIGEFMITESHQYYKGYCSQCRN